MLAELVTLPDSAVESVLANLQLHPSYVPVFRRRTCYKLLCLLQSADKSWPANDSRYLDGVEDLCELLNALSTNSRAHINKHTSIHLDRLIHNRLWPLVWCLKAVLADKDMILLEPPVWNSPTLDLQPFHLPPSTNVAQRKSQVITILRYGACLMYLGRSLFSPEGGV